MNGNKRLRALTIPTAICLMATLSFPAASDPVADNARAMVKAMSDYLSSQDAIKFEFNSTLEVVSTEGQKFGLASSGSIQMERPDKLHATRHGGFANVEVTYDGKTLSMLGKGKNLYAQKDISGTIDQLVDTLRSEYGRPLPAADLLMSNVYDELMPEVTEIKDLGSGVINGVECDHLAFRTSDVDWQLWIAQGDAPYPCRYVITTREVDGDPQYSIEIRNWVTGAAASGHDFSFAPPDGAKMLEPKDLQDFDELPSHLRPKS